MKWPLHTLWPVSQPECYRHGMQEIRQDHLGDPMKRRFDPQMALAERGDKISWHEYREESILIDPIWRRGLPDPGADRGLGNGKLLDRCNLEVTGTWNFQGLLQAWQWQWSGAALGLAKATADAGILML